MPAGGFSFGRTCRYQSRRWQRIGPTDRETWLKTIAVHALSNPRWLAIGAIGSYDRGARQVIPSESRGRASGRTARFA